MILSVYLHDEIANVLKSFGEISDVVNKMLDDIINNNYDLMDKPNAPSREKAKRFQLNVLQEDYLQLLSTFSINSPRISLRRIIYWFVENEIYNDLQWEQCNYYKNINITKILKFIEIVKSDTIKLNLILPKKLKHKADEINVILKYLEEYFKNELQYINNNENKN